MKPSFQTQDKTAELLIDSERRAPAATAELLPLVEIELRRIAHILAGTDHDCSSLQTTALIDKAYLKLNKGRAVCRQSRVSFFTLCSKILRRIVINHARDAAAQGGESEEKEQAAGNSYILSAEKSAEILALDKALNELAEFDLLKSRIVELKYFTGLSIAETAEILEISPEKVAAHWRLARAWLIREIRRNQLF